MSTQKIARRVTSTENDKLLLTTGGDKTFQNVSVTDILSEGEIEGFVAGGASIFLDGNPMFDESDAPVNPTADNYATGSTSSNTTTITMSKTLSNVTMPTTGKRFVAIHEAVETTAQITKDGEITATAFGGQDGVKLTITVPNANPAVFVDSMVYDPGEALSFMTLENLAHGDASVKVVLNNGEELLGYLSAVTNNRQATFSCGYVNGIENYIDSTELDAGNSHLVKIAVFYELSSIASTSLTVASALTVDFSGKEFSFTPTTASSFPSLSERKYPGSSYQFRTGTPTQPPMRYIGGIGTSTVALQFPTDNLLRGTTRTITTGTLPGAQVQEIDRVRILINYPNGLSFINTESGGDDRPAGAGYRFEISVKRGSGSFSAFESLGGNYGPGSYNAGSTDATGSETIVGHTAMRTSALAIEHTIDLQPFQPFTDFQIRITRLTNHGTKDGSALGEDFRTAHFGDRSVVSTSGNMQQFLTSLGGKAGKYVTTATSIISSVSGIITEKLNYPFTAMVNVGFNSKSFNNVPKRAYELKGLKIQVPSNYVTRDESGDVNKATYNRSTSTGLPVVDGSNNPLNQAWDGNFRTQKVYSNNPAWVFYDILTNNRYGLGEWLQTTDIDKYSLYKIGKYCDELVPDGKGGQEPRFTANLYLTKATDAFKVLKDMATIFRSILYWQNGELYPVLDEKKEPIYNFSKANVIDGKFSYEGTGSKTRINQYIVSWNNPDSQYKLEPIIVEDKDDIVRKGRIIQGTAVAFGCTSEGQAIRYGRWKLWTGLNQTEVVSFKTGLNASFLVPGDIINITDNDEFNIPFSGRVSAYTESGNPELTLDRDLDAFLPVSGYTYTISVVVPKKVAILNQDSATVNGVSYNRGAIIATAKTVSAVGTGTQVTLINVDSNTTQLNVSNALDDSNNALHLILRDSTIVQERTLTGSATVGGTSVQVPSAAVEGRTTVRLTSALDDDTLSDVTESIWVIRQIETSSSSATASSPKEYKILGIIEDEDKGMFDISAVRHYNAKFDAIETDFNLAIEDPVFPPEPDTSPPAPAAIRILRKFNRFKPGEEVTIEWDKPLNYDFVKNYEVTHNFNEATQVVVQNETARSLSFSGLPDGVYSVSIRTRSNQNKLSAPTSQAVDIADIFAEGERIFGLRKGCFCTTDMNITTAGNLFFENSTYKIGPQVSESNTVTLRTTNNPSNANSTSQSATALASDSWVGETRSDGNLAYIYYDYSSAASGSDDMIRLVSWKQDPTLANIKYWYDADKYAANVDNVWTNLSGTVTVAAGSNKVVGSGTSFSSLDLTRILKIGASFAGTITGIVSDTELFLDRSPVNAIGSTAPQVDELGIDYINDFLLGQVSRASSGGAYDWKSYINVGKDSNLTTKSMTAGFTIAQLNYSANGTMVSVFSNIKLAIQPIGFEIPEIRVTGAGFTQTDQSEESGFTEPDVTGARVVTLHNTASTGSPAITFTGGDLVFDVQVREKNNTSITRTQSFTLTKSKAAATDSASNFVAEFTKPTHTFFQSSSGVVSNSTSFSGSFSVTSAGASYTYAASGTTDNTFNITAGGVDGSGITNANQISISNQGVVTLANNPPILTNSSITTGSFTLTLRDLGDSNSLIGVFTVNLEKLTMVTRSSSSYTISTADVNVMNEYKGETTFTDAVAQSVLRTVLLDSTIEVPPDGINNEKRIVPNDRITLKYDSGGVVKVATRIFTGGNDNGTPKNVTDTITEDMFSSVVVKEFDGSVIVDGTLSANTISGGTITGNSINVQNNLNLDTNGRLIMQNDGAIHTTGKTSFGHAAPGVFLGGDGSFHLGSNTDFLKYQSDGTVSIDGSLKLNLTGDAGADSISILQTNESHLVPTDANGTNADFTGSGTNITVFVGATQCTFDGSGANTFSASISNRDNVSDAGNTLLADNDKTFVVPVITALDDDAGSRTISLTIRGADGTLIGTAGGHKTVQSFARSKQGLSGTGGKAFNRVVGPGFTDPNREDGLNENAAIIATLGRDPANGDVIILVNSSTNDQVAYKHNDTEFDEVQQFLNGSLLVTDSITTSQIDADAITASELAISNTANSGSGIFFDTTTTNLNPRIVIREGNAERVILGKLS